MLDTLTLEDARKLIAVAKQKAIEINQPMNIAVVDAGGNLIAHVRMDGAWIGSIDISINKAFSAKAFDMSTRTLWEVSQSGGAAHGIQVSNNGQIMTFGGGFPLKRNGQVVGAIGISGGWTEQDEMIGKAVVEAFESGNL